MDYSKLNGAIKQHHKPTLASATGSVYQVWDDGEITIQRSGPLLWTRNFHSIEPPLHTRFPADLFPETFGPNVSGYVFTDHEGAHVIRELMLSLLAPN